MALQPRQLAKEIDTTLAEGRFSGLRCIYDDLNEPRRAAEHAVHELLRAVDELPAQWDVRLAAVRSELAIEEQRTAKIQQERAERLARYEAEVRLLEEGLKQTGERERIEAELLRLRAENSVRSQKLLAASENAPRSSEVRQQLAVQFTQHLPLDIERARTRYRTPSRAWHSVGVLCCADQKTAHMPLVSQYPALEKCLDVAPLKREKRPPSSSPSAKRQAVEHD